MKSAWALSGVLALSLVLPLRGKEFTDLSADHWARDEILVAVGHGVLEGFDGKFYGEKLVNRYQLAWTARKLMEAEGMDVSFVPPDDPEDVPSTHWASSGVRAALAYGYMGPYLEIDPQDRRFHGEKLINRYQFSVFLAAHVERIDAGMPEARIGLPKDVPESHWAAPAVRRVLDSQLLPMSGQRFFGEKLINRYQLAVAIGSLLPPVPAGGGGGLLGKVWDKAAQGGGLGRVPAASLDAVERDLEELTARLMDFDERLEGYQDHPGDGGTVQALEKAVADLEAAIRTLETRRK